MTVIVDNPSWFLPHAEKLVSLCREGSDDAVLVRSHADVRDGVAAFYLSCVNITPPEVLARNSFNLVVHESDLPRGRGFAPVAWQVLEGKNSIPVCLFEAVAEADAGPVYARTTLELQGHELNDEIREAQAAVTISLCRRFLASPEPPVPTPQQGEPTSYPRRRARDSELDTDKTIAELFPLLRTVDNVRYPAYFELNGRRYRLTITRDDGHD